MAFKTFVPPTNGKFSIGGTQSHEPKILSAQFGNGYAQEAVDGLNADLMTLSLSWEALTPAEGQAVMDFFAGQKGILPFKFTLPGEDLPRKFKCKKWQRRFSTETLVDVSANWNEVADAE